jgi:hypothetical protein
VTVTVSGEFGRRYIARRVAPGGRQSGGKTEEAQVLVLLSAPLGGPRIQGD